MDVVSRSQAIKLGLNKYFTGLECRNGHIAERYVQSGTCEMCIRTAAISIPSNNPQRSEIAQQRLKIAQDRLELAKERARLRAEELTQRLELAKERARLKAEELRLKTARAASRESKSQFIKIRVVCPPEDIQALRDFVYSLAIIRVPSIRLSDVCPNGLPSNGIYTFLCAPEDRQVINDYGWHLHNVRNPTSIIAVERERITSELESEREANESTEWPTGDPR